MKDPDPKRDLLYINDFVEAYIKFLDYNDSSFEVLNIGYGKSYSVQNIVGIIQKFLQNPIEIKFSGEKRKNEVMDTIADISKMKKLTGWNPKYDLEEGIEIITTEMRNI